MKGSELVETKKMLVSYDLKRPQGASNDFLVPISIEGRMILFGLKSGRERGYGLVVYIGTSINEKDVFDRIPDSKARIENVDDTLTRLRQYLEKLQTLRLGNIVRLIPNQNEDGGYELELVAKRPKIIPYPLP